MPAASRNPAVPNATQIKFGDPHTRIAQTAHWSVQQFWALSGAAFADLRLRAAWVAAAE
jgi:hypothetical protein